MADRLRLGQAGQVNPALARVRPQPRLERRRLVDVDPGRVEAAAFEDQRLFEIEPAIAGEGFPRQRRLRFQGEVGRP